MIIHRNVMINKAGGNSSKNGKVYRISLPISVIKTLGITEDDKSIILEIKDNNVIMKKDRSIRDF